MFGSLSFAAWGFGTLGRVCSLGVRIFGLCCLGIRNFGSAVFWLAGYLGVQYFGWSPFSGCLDPWASLLGGSEFWVYGILASWIFGPGSAQLDLRLSLYASTRLGTFQRMFPLRSVINNRNIISHQNDEASELVAPQSGQYCTN